MCSFIGLELTLTLLFPYRFSEKKALAVDHIAGFQTQLFIQIWSFFLSALFVFCSMIQGLFRDRLQDDAVPLRCKFEDIAFGNEYTFRTHFPQENHSPYIVYTEVHFQEERYTHFLSCHFHK